MKFTFSELHNCAKREVAMRKRVYPKKVREHGWPENEAHVEISMMEAIADHLAIMRDQKEGLGL